MNSTNVNELYTFLKGENSKKTFAQIGGKTISYRQLLSDIDKLHVVFNQKGLKKGDQVVLSVQGEYYTGLFFLAFLRYGITTVFIDPDVPCFRAVSIIKSCDVQGFVMDEKLFNDRQVRTDDSLFTLKVKKANQKKGKLFKKLLKKDIDKIDNSTFPAVLDSVNTVLDSLPSVEATDLAYIIFTSGTSSSPKGVMINHKTYLHTFKRLQKFTSLMRTVGS